MTYRKTYTKEELSEILRKHKNWLLIREDGERANLENADLRGANLKNVNLRNADLRGANLRNANLRGANLKNVNLGNADLRGANLENADLRGANLENANLKNANLKNANLWNADLENANLWNADLENANLKNANLKNANLKNAHLKNADLKNVIHNESTSFYTLSCPDEGSFIAWKKSNRRGEKVLVKLLILEDSKRSSATSYKCRASKVKVLRITDLKEREEFNECFSEWNPSFKYELGKIIEVPDFNEDRWQECTKGIHFFISKQMAINWQR